MNELSKNQYSVKTQVYEESHEALNRDSCTNLAKEWSNLMFETQNENTSGLD